MRRRAAVSQVNQYWICHEVQSDLPRNLLCLKVAPDCISYLVLEFSQIFTLRCDPALTSRSIPKGDEKTRLLARLDLEDYFVHAFTVQSAETRSQIS